MEKSQNAVEGGKSKKQENKEKGMIAEDLFLEFLNGQKIPFIQVDQTKETFSEELHEKQAHRPDFIAHTKNGVFYIDVKYRERKPFGAENEKRFRLDQFQIYSLFNFQNELHSAVWIAFTDDLNTPNFSYAPISEIYKYLIKIYDEINRKCSKEIKEKFEECLIHIPNALLYDHFSFENGFYKEPELNFFEVEAAYHIEKAKEIKNPRAVKWSRIISHKKIIIYTIGGIL